DIAFASESIKTRVELAVFFAQQDRRRTETREILRLDLAANPPVGIMVCAQPSEGLARARQIVALTPAEPELARRLHELVLVLCGEIHRRRFRLSIRFVALPRPIAGRGVSRVCHRPPPDAGITGLRAHLT